MTSPVADRTREIHESLAPVRAVLAARDAEILASQVAVTEIPAPTGEEGRRAEWIAGRLESLRLRDVHVDGAGNVCGTRAGQRRPALHSSSVPHLDTVFPRDAIGTARREGNRIFAPGIGDNGRGLATLLAIAGVDRRQGDQHAATNPVRRDDRRGRKGRPARRQVPLRPRRRRVRGHCHRRHRRRTRGPSRGRLAATAGDASTARAAIRGRTSAW